MDLRGPTRGKILGTLQGPPDPLVFGPEDVRISMPCHANISTEVRTYIYYMYIHAYQPLIHASIHFTFTFAFTSQDITLCFTALHKIHYITLRSNTLCTLHCKIIHITLHCLHTCLYTFHTCRHTHTHLHIYIYI